MKSLTGLDPMNYGGQRIKDELRTALKAEVPPTDQWRLPFLEKLLARRTEAFYSGDCDKYHETNELIHSLVIN